MNFLHETAVRNAAEPGYGDYANLDGVTEATTTPVMGGHTVGINMRRLKKLKNRLTPEQMQKRREKMHKSGTWRTNMDREHAATRGLMVEAFKSVGNRLNKVNHRLYYLTVASVIAYAALVGRVLGWW